MTEDPLALLALANPVPATVTPAPIDGLLAKIDNDMPAASRPPESRRRWRPLRLVAPTLGIAVALAVAAAAILLIHTPTQTAQTHPASHTTPTKLIPGFVPSGGMRGTVNLSGVAFTSNTNGVLSFQQCSPCTGAKARTRDWLATTHDAGRHWKVAQAPYNLQDPVFTGVRDGWAFGVSASREALYYVTHDGGTSWTPAHLTGNEIAYTTPVAVADGTAWAIGNHCSSGASCTYAVIRGPAGRSTLTPTASQPAPHAQTMIITAGSKQTAYATTTSNGGRTSHIYATHDDGRHWAQITSGCRDSAPAAIGNDTLWEQCSPRSVAESNDSGGHWHHHQANISSITDLVPVSATIAWAITSPSTLVRTTNDGRTWHAYLHAATKVPAGHPATATAIGVLSATSATTALDYPTAHHRTQILIARAIGPTNPSGFIKLPPGLR
jgi:photosystem II stability/assembly factor-like uncharacterized protein